MVGGMATSSAKFVAKALETTTTSGLLTLNSNTITTGTVADFSFDALTQGIGLNLDANLLTTGQILKASSTSPNLSTGNLGLFDWSPSNWATASGDLVKLNIGPLGDITGNMFAIYDNSSELFSVDTTKITSALPHEFTAAGDVTIAYDLVFSNQTSSNIKAKGPLTIDAGESFESNDLTLRTYNSGQVIVDSTANGGLAVSSNAGSYNLNGLFSVEGAKTGKALVILNEDGNQNILAASASGTARFTLGRNGDVASNYSTSLTTGNGLLLDWQGATSLTGATSALNVTATDITGNAQNFFGINISDLGTAGGGNEYGGYVQGTDWDYSMVLEDKALLNSTLDGGTVMKIDNSDADIASNTYLLDLEFTDVSDDNAYWLRALDSNGTARLVLAQSVSNDYYLTIGNPSVVSQRLNVSYDIDGNAGILVSNQTANGMAVTQYDTSITGAPWTFMGQADDTSSAPYTSRGFITTEAGLNGILLYTQGSGDDIRLMTAGDTDDYLYALTSSNIPQLFWETGMSTNDAGLRLSATDDTGKLQYRDENSATWVSFDSFGLASADYWQFNSQQLAPGNVTWDLAVGGISTVAASFIAYGVETAAGGVADIVSDVTTTGDVLGITSSTLTAGTLLNLNTGSANTWNAGSLLKVNSTSTGLTTGNLGLFDWSPSNWATSSGDLFKINIGSLADTTGNLLAIYDNASELFSVDTTKITSAIPHEFTAAGDVSIAYDLVFTNQTASTIDSYGPLTVRAGESFENNNLTLKTYGTGAIIMDGKFSLNSQETLEDSVTPSVGGASHFVEANGTNRLITNFTNGAAGQIIFIEVGTANIDLDCTSSSLNCGTNDFVAVLAAGDQLEFIYDGTMWNLIAWLDASARLDDNTDGVDIAEFFPSNQALEVGEIVKVDPEHPEHVIRSASAYESSVIGVVSTNPGIMLGENPDGTSYSIALAGRVPVKISNTSDNIIPGDYITTSTEPGKAMKSNDNGRVIGQALEDWTPQSGKDTISIFINNTWYEPIQLSESGDIQLAQDSANPGFVQLTDNNGSVISKLSGLTDLITNSFNAFQGTVDRMLVKVGLVSPEVLTQKIAPLEGEKDIEIQIGDSTSTSLSTSGSSTSSEPSGFGKLLIKDRYGNVAASPQPPQHL